MKKTSSRLRGVSVKIRFRQLADGRKSIYLDIYSQGKRRYEFLKLYVLPEHDEETARANARTMRIAESMKLVRGNIAATMEAGRRTGSSSAELRPALIEKRGADAGIAAVATERRRNRRSKEPVRIRFRKLAHGSRSVYLATNINGKRTYEYLRLYLIPETDEAARMQNRRTMEAVYAIKARRILCITAGAAGIRRDERAQMRLTEWLGIYRDRQMSMGKTSVHRWVRTVIFALNGYDAGKKATLADIDRRWLTDFMFYLMNEYITYKHTRPAKGTVDNYLRCLKAALNVAVDEGILRANPMSGLDRSHLKDPCGHREFLTVGEVKRLIDTPCRRHDVKSAFLFACFCGLRISDVRGLRWGNVVADGGRTHLELTLFKTRQPLFLPLNRQALRWMPPRGNAGDDDRIFSRLAQDMSVLGAWAREAGIKKHVTFHVSRHTFATMALTMGADLYTTSRLLGHTEIRTTQIYARIVNSKKEEAVSPLDSAFE